MYFHLTYTDTATESVCMCVCERERLCDVLLVNDIDGIDKCKDERSLSLLFLRLESTKKGSIYRTVHV